MRCLSLFISRKPAVALRSSFVVKTHAAQTSDVGKVKSQIENAISFRKREEKRKETLKEIDDGYIEGSTSSQGFEIMTNLMNKYLINIRKCRIILQGISSTVVRLLICFIAIIFLITCSQKPCKADELTREENKQLEEILKEYKNHIEKGEIEKAHIEILKVQTRWPKRFHLALGNEYFNKQYYKKATGEYEKVLEYEPDLAEAHGQLARIYFFSGNDQKAFEECKMALKVESNNAGYHYLLSGILVEMGNLDESLHEIKKAIDINPDFAPFLFLMGRIYEEMENQDEALNAYLKAISIDEAYSSAYSSAITIYLDLDRDEQAIKLIKKYLELEPDDYITKEILHRLTSKKVSNQNQLSGD
jgi:Flp pilus assembly protein TadD